MLEKIITYYIRLHEKERKRRSKIHSMFLEKMKFMIKIVRMSVIKLQSKT